MDKGDAPPTARLIRSGGWSEANYASVHTLLTEYHDIFSQKTGELGCASLAKHEIQVVDDKPFKERYQRIPPPMVEEVRFHMKEMLEADAICPSQSPWLNAVMSVWKDGGLHFCIDFHKLNVRTKNDFYPLSHIQEAIDRFVGTGCFSFLDLKAYILQITMNEALKQCTAFTVENLGFFKCEHMPIGLCNSPSTFQRLMQNCLGELSLTYCII